MASSSDGEDEKPLDPAVERVRRRVMRFIAINLGILFVALMAVAIAIVYRLGAREDEAPPVVRSESRAGPVAAEGRIVLPTGAHIVSHALSGQLMAVRIELAGGGQAFLLYDLAAGEVVSSVTVEEAQ